MTVAEKKKRQKLKALNRAVIKAQILAAELGASAVILSLSRARDDVMLTIAGELETCK